MQMLKTNMKNVYSRTVVCLSFALEGKSQNFRRKDSGLELVS